MAGNTFGDILKVTTFGESHGVAIGCVIDGVPPGIALVPEDIQKDLDRRKPGQSEVTTPRKESDIVEVLSGVFEGKTTGTSLALLIRNSDQHSADYDALRDVFRPGHADQTYLQKFGLRDHRGGGRASGRETAARVAAGAVAKKILAHKNICITGYTLAAAGVQSTVIDLEVIEKNIMRAPDLEAAREMVKRVEAARLAGDSVGGIIEIIVTGCPAGLGDPVFDKIDALLSHALISIGGIKGIEFGAGFSAAGMMGSDHNDAPETGDEGVLPSHNYAGGIIGGITNGEPLVLRLAVKPTSSITTPQQAWNKDMALTEIAIKGRHDPCLCPRIVPVAEAMTALVVADRLLLQQTIR